VFESGELGGHARRFPLLSLHEVRGKTQGGKVQAKKALIAGSYMITFLQKSVADRGVSKDRPESYRKMKRRSVTLGGQCAFTWRVIF